MDMWPRPSDEHTLERKDNERGYCPGNCTWATRSEQSQNRRTFFNNDTGYPGVERKGLRFSARYSEGGTNYNLGRHSTAEDANRYRETFIGLLHKDRKSALKMCERRARYDSTTKVKGITPHVDGGFLARVTVKGVRLYLGYFKTIEAAKAAMGVDRA
jgi:hypothetical protein